MGKKSQKNGKPTRSKAPIRSVNSLINEKIREMGMKKTNFGRDK